MNLKKFIFNKMTLMAFVLAVLYQFFMLGIYLGGYKYTAKNMDNSTIVYVNHDGKSGQTLIKSLSKSMNFKSKHLTTIKEGKQYLRNHKAVLVMDVPSHYAEHLAAGKQAHFNFYTNSAGDSLSNQTGSSIASEVTKKMNAAVTSKKMTATMTRVMVRAAKPQITAQIKAAIKADPTLATNKTKLATTQKQITQQFTTKFEKQSASMTKLNNVTAHSTDINTKSNPLNKMMAPMMVGLAGFVAAMTCSSILFSAFTREVGKKARNKWKAYFGLEIVYLGVAVMAALASTMMVVLINGLAVIPALQLFGVSVVNTFVSFQLLNLVNLIFGQLSIFINIPLVLIQAISSGSVMAAPLMLPFYRWLRVILPVPSTWQLNLDILFHTTSSGSPALHLVMIGIISLVLSLFVVFYKYKPSKDKTIESLDESGRVLP